MVSYHQPIFCSNATWNSTPVVLANNDTLSGGLISTFVDTNDTIYVAVPDRSQVQIRFHGSPSPNVTLPNGVNSSYAVFADFDGNVYVDDGGINGCVNQWRPGSSTPIQVMNISTNCYGLFVDRLHNLYCSASTSHQVMVIALDNRVAGTTVIAGNGTGGVASDLLSLPRGIFVDENLDLYVADCENDRIQMFRRGQRNGITLAGNGANGTIGLFRPVSVVLDKNGYLFIADARNHRIVGSGPNGFRCVINCVTGSGSSPAGVLYHPRSVHFDSGGNMIVTDSGITRILKFLLLTDSCGM